MIRIPMSGDLVDAIGPFAERVENRSLLLDKFPFHKQWGSGEIKANDAHRWTLLRISEGGSAMLSREAEIKRSESNRLSEKNPEKFHRLQTEAEIARSLSATRVESAELTALRSQHTRRFIGLFREAFSGRSVVSVAQLEGRLAMNLADSLIQNAGISLDRLFGMPFIPGSAVKGVCRHAALEQIKTTDPSDLPLLLDQFREVFGTSESDFARGDLRDYRALLGGRAENYRGRVSFLPAYPLNEARIVLDLTCVHYPDYYRTGQMQDLSIEKPQPNPFPVVEVGAQFAFCLVLNRPKGSDSVLESARQWLESALTVRGLGAKTASGYGWFSLKPEILEQIDSDAKRESEQAAAKVRLAMDEKARQEAADLRRAAMSPAEAARERYAGMGDEAFAKTASELGALTSDEQRGFIMVLQAAEKRDTWKRWKKSDKPANRARVEGLLAAAKSLGVALI